MKNKWKCVLKDGMVHINGKDYLFAKCTGYGMFVLFLSTILIFIVVRAVNSSGSNVCSIAVLVSIGNWPLLVHAPPP